MIHILNKVLIYFLVLCKISNISSFTNDGMVIFKANFLIRAAYQIKDPSEIGNSQGKVIKEKIVHNCFLLLQKPLFEFTAARISPDILPRN